MYLECKAAKVNQNTPGVFDPPCILLHKQCCIFESPSLLPMHFQLWKHLSQNLLCVLGFTSSSSLLLPVQTVAASWPLSPAWLSRRGWSWLCYLIPAPSWFSFQHPNPLLKHPASNLMHVKHVCFSSAGISVQNEQCLEEQQVPNCKAPNFQGSHPLQDYRISFQYL